MIQVGAGVGLATLDDLDTRQIVVATRPVTSCTGGTGCLRATSTVVRFIELQAVKL